MFQVHIPYQVTYLHKFPPSFPFLHSAPRSPGFIVLTMSNLSTVFLPAALPLVSSGALLSHDSWKELPSFWTQPLRALRTDAGMPAKSRRLLLAPFNTSRVPRVGRENVL